MTTTPQSCLAGSPASHEEQHRSQTLRRELHALICETFLQMRPTLQVADTDDLVDLGVLDSLAFVELVDRIQLRYGVVIRDLDITRENFGSIAAMASYVLSRRSM